MEFEGVVLRVDQLVASAVTLGTEESEDQFVTPVSTPRTEESEVVLRRVEQFVALEAKRVHSEGLQLMEAHIAGDTFVCEGYQAHQGLDWLVCRDPTLCRKRSGCTARIAVVWRYAS